MYRNKSISIIFHQNLDYNFSVTNKLNKSETYFIVQLADDLEKKTEIALQNYFSPLLHVEIKENNVVPFTPNVPLRRNCDILSDENKQLQYAITESLKAVLETSRSAIESDFSFGSPQLPKKRKILPEEEFDDSNRNCSNVTCNMKLNNVSSIAIDANHNNNDGLVNN